MTVKPIIIDALRRATNEVGKKPGEREISGRIQTIQNTELLKSARILS